MKIPCRALPAWALLIACLPPLVQAQEPSGTVVTGTVVDSANQPISGVLVFMDGVSPVLTGAVGAFRLEIDRLGTYVLSLRKAGFAPRTFRLPITRNEGADREVGVIMLEPGPDPTGTVSGRVTDRIRGEPVRNALVEVNGNMVAVTNADGTFNVLQVPLAWGPNQFHVSRLSYTDATSELWLVNPDDWFALDVALIPVPVGVLPEIVVEADRTLMVYGRMRLAARIHEMRADGLTNVQVTFSRASQGFGEPCASPDIYLDGAVVQGGFFLNDLLNPDQIEGIEVYRSTTTTPPQFQKPGSTCGSIVIWTR